jgi:transcription elongation GreA/GreB family factor
MTRETTQIDSNEINPARQRPVSRQGTYSVTGEILGEMSFGSHEDLLLAALQAAAWTSQVTITAATISATASDNSFNDSGSGFTFTAGQMVSVSGFTTNPTENNIVYGIIATAAAGKITIESPVGDTIVDEAAGDSVTIATLGDSLIVGETVPTFAIVERHTDIGVDYVYRGNRVNGFNLAAPINSAGQITFPVQGEVAEKYTFPGDETFAAATSTEMMVTTQGGFTEGGVDIDYLTDYNLEVTNNMSPLFTLFQRPAYTIRNGIFQASGSMTSLLPGATLFDKYLDEDFTDHVVQLTEGGSSYWFRLPNVIYTQADKAVAGQEEILPSYTISAGWDGAAGTTVEVFRSV